MDNLDSARAFLTGKKIGKILRFSIFDGIPKKKFEKKFVGGFPIHGKKLKICFFENSFKMH